MDNRFIVYKSMENVFTFTIKQNGSMVPLLLTDTDTFTAKIMKIDDNSEPANVTLTVNKLTPYANGKIELVLSGTGIANLVSEKGTKADRYYLKPTYKILIQCDTVGNGNFVARIDEVFVDA